MNKLPIDMFIKIFSAAILRLSEVKDELIKDLEKKEATTNDEAQKSYEKLL